MRLLAMILGLWSSVLTADPVDDVMAVANARFANMPQLQMVDTIAGNCGAKPNVNRAVAYCTTTGTIHLTRAARMTPQAPYLVAHVLGHAIQVRHGVADVALAAIRANRAQEPALRTNVEQMVDCIAGLLMFHAGHTPSNLTVWFETDPWAEPHWGRKPLSAGPIISVPLEMRNDWYRRGQGDYLSACATQVFPVDLLLKVYRD